MFKFSYLFTMILATLVCSSPLQATEISDLQQRISAFKQSPDQRFAPQTLERAEAYLGAAMLAAEQEKTANVDAALAKVSSTLTEARQTVRAFKTNFAAMLRLRKDALASSDVVGSAVHTSASDSQPQSSQQLRQQADSELKVAIASHEQGQLNQTQNHADAAKQYYSRLLDLNLPTLTNMTASAVGKAASAGAKKYTPVLYQASKDKLAELRAFNDGISSTRPDSPEQGVYLALEAKHLTEQVKAWRKKSGSHEQLILKNRDFKLRLASQLDPHGQLGLHDQSGLHNRSDKLNNPMLIDIASQDLLRAINKLHQDLRNERQAHQQELTRLKQSYAQELQNKLAAQTDAMTQAQQSQMSNIKEAFRAKLERETYEKKRQKKLRQMFQAGEVEILINLDGSLLIRLVSLQFESAKSKIDSSYFDLLGRLQQAMAIYQERSFRIEGHTDNYGGVKPNQLLSLKRAEAVRDFLIAASSDGARLKALGYGEVRPIASNEFAQGRAMNRRIDVVINAPE